MATPSSCVFGCVNGTSCNVVLLYIRLGVGRLQLGIVFIDEDWAAPQQLHSWQPTQILSRVLAEGAGHVSGLTTRGTGCSRT